MRIAPPPETAALNLIIAALKTFVHDTQAHRQ